ncbi:MAG TPA: hypothetical protein VM432_08085, partial [Bdellovibrionales bacterium]|nr:hypothetical protein [Bdellovibrionales bacterium]
TDVGQDQIRALWAAKGRAWPAGDVPHAFSFYEYDKTNRTLYNDTAGVISYGTLARNVVGGIAAWDPGHKIGPADANHIPPPPSSTLYNMGHRILRSQLCKSGTITSVGTLSAFSPITCTGSGPSGYATALLNGTRTGIADPHIALNVIGPVGYNSSQSAILPMNFDVGAFQTALLNTSAGELGSYFGFSGFLGEPFNGIVYITSRWPGSEDGYSPEGIAKGWPLNGSLTSWFVHNRDPNQIYLSHDSQHRALPFPLCSDTQTDGTTGAGDPFDNDGGTQRFRIAPCTSYGEDPDTVLAAYPSAIRLVNGRNFDQAALGTQGLSIVSNLPVYIQGSYNSNSNPASTVESEWTPSLVAGDMITVLSDAWDDAESNWRVAASLGPRVAVSSTYNTALLLGWARQSRNASRGVPASGIPVMMENWAGQPLHFTGAIAVGYYPVYYRQNPVYNFANPMSFTYSAGERYISYDPHFNTPARQPPGTPMFYISSVLNWKVD